MSNDVSKNSLREGFGLLLAIIGFIMLICGSGIGFGFIGIGAILFFMGVFK